MPLKPIELEVEETGREVLLFCRHRKEWPPIQALLDETPEELLARGLITQTKYLQVGTWLKVCGLQEMGSKCLTCPAALRQENLKNILTLVPHLSDASKNVPPTYRLRIRRR